MKNSRNVPYLIKLIAKLAPKVGAKFVLEPEWKVAGQIIYPNGIVRSLRMYSMDMNHMGSSSVAKDKDYAKFFMKKRGYPIAKGQTIFEDNWAKIVKSNRTILHATKYAKKLGYPVIVKPNSKSKGIDVNVVYDEKKLILALHKIFKGDKVAIVERYMPGRDYRVVVLDKEIISAYERISLSVTGDGKNSIFALLKQKQQLFVSSDRNTKIDFDDKRIKLKLKKLGYTFTSIPAKNQQIFLLDNANLSTGGDAVDATDTIHRGFRKIAIDLTRDMGLRVAGVDIMVTKGDITKNPNNPKDCSYYIIEINSAPGLDHYVTTGKAQRKIVEDMYLKVLKALGKKD